jgi:putative MATE family efflux protein
MQENINFGNGKVSALFSKMFWPTITGMVFSTLLMLTDGIFVGNGIGSNALAAINLVAPMWLFTTGLGLMFGTGASVTASIWLAQNKEQDARVIMTQAVVVSTIIITIASALVIIYSHPILRMLGCSQELMQPARDYLIGFIPFMPINTLLYSSSYFVRVEGSPKYAMTFQILAAVLNIIFDYLFIFPLHMGVFGAAIATSLGSVAGCIGMVLYLFNPHHRLHFTRLPLTRASMASTWTNMKHVTSIGASSFLGELSGGCEMLCGNLTFMAYMGDTGVAAYGIAYYIFPVVFMFNSSIAASVQPIISFNHGLHRSDRVKQALRLGLVMSIITSIAMTVFLFIFSYDITSMFLPPSVQANIPTHDAATYGIPINGLQFMPFAISMILIGFFQSIEHGSKATILTVLRGFILMFTCFIVMPKLFGVTGIWLAVPTSEFITMLVAIAMLVKIAKKTPVAA